MISPRGSIWRKWDLHIHTPASFHWNGGKQFREMSAGEKDATLTEITRSINQSEVAAFGIMDYWTFDGYWAVRDHIEKSHQEFGKTIFPGMELRIEAPVDYRLNIHAILSDFLTKQQLQDFKAALRIGGSDRPISDESLIEFGRSLDHGVASSHGFTPDDLEDDDQALQLGSKTAKITRESLKAAQKAVPAKTCLIIMPFDTSDGLEDLDWETHPYDDAYFMQSAHIFETRRPANVNLFLNIETDTNRHFIANFIKTMGGKPKPAISGSDAHKITDYGAFPGDRITWIKADETFQGLLQVVNEPVERSYIGTIPPKVALVQQKSTKYIDSLEIKRKGDATLAEAWFNNDIPFNTDLIAVIGNKGKGKSALTDIIGLLANTRQHKEFTFLSEKNFRQLKQNKARNFRATLRWRSGATTSKGLEQEIDEQQPELVKYIPQNFLESICTQLGGIEETEFDRELKKVIFSHVDLASRLGRESLDDLIGYKTTEASDQLRILRQELHKINEEFVSLDTQCQPEHRTSLENLLKLKQEELEAHNTIKPEAEHEPTNDPIKQAEISRVAELLAESKNTLSQLDALVKAAAADQIRNTQLVSLADKITARVENLERQVQNFVAQTEPDIISIGLKLTEVVAVTINKAPLTAKRQSFAILAQEAANRQDPSIPDSPAQKKYSVEKSIEELQANLDEPNKRYEDYLTALKKWEEQRNGIVGDAETPDTLRFIERQLQGLANLPMLLTQCKWNRLAKVKEIHAVIRQLTQTYRDLYAPVNQFIEARPLAREKFQLNFEVGIVDTGFSGAFFDFISHGKVGTFCGVEEGQQRLRDLLAKQDFNTEEGIEKFLTEITDALENDKRPGGGVVTVADQMRTRKHPIDLYDYIFSLEYLKPRYALRMGDKELNQLSPGERGTLLLVFYLLVDKNDIPLVIDQPEENLDNQTVYDLLVPCFKEAKQRRQIFIVTHNPNLAVVCDAEQIIWADLDKKNNYQMHYKSGSIESQVLNRASVDILEGTMPAFDNRDSKYF